MRERGDFNCDQIVISKVQEKINKTHEIKAAGRRASKSPPPRPSSLSPFSLSSPSHFSSSPIINAALNGLSRFPDIPLFFHLLLSLSLFLFNYKPSDQLLVYRIWRVIFPLSTHSLHRVYFNKVGSYTKTGRHEYPALSALLPLTVVY
jgi:hypothetical protein